MDFLDYLELYLDIYLDFGTFDGLFGLFGPKLGFFGLLMDFLDYLDLYLNFLDFDGLFGLFGSIFGL